MDVSDSDTTEVLMSCQIQVTTDESAGVLFAKQA